MRQGGLLLTFLLIHLGLAAWNLFHFEPWTEPRVLVPYLVVRGLLPLGFFLLTWMGSRWARWLLAGLFALFGGTSMTAAVLKGWLASQQPDTPLVSEHLVFLSIFALVNLGMAFVLVRTRATTDPADGVQAPVKEDPRG